MTTASSSADALAERLFRATLGALELFSVYLGAELGLYRASVQEGTQTADGLARAAGSTACDRHGCCDQCCGGGESAHGRRGYRFG